MRIVHYLSSVRLAEGGVTRAVLDMCSVLAARGHEVVLLSIFDDDVPHAWKSDAPSPGTPRSVKLPPPTGRLQRLSSEAVEIARRTLQAADAAHVHAMWTPSNTQIAAVARRERVPYVVSSHGMLDDWSMARRTWKKRLYLALSGNAMLRAASFIHLTADAELEQSRKWFPPGKGLVIPLVFDLELFRDLPGPSIAHEKFPPSKSDEPKVLFLSRLYEGKGLEHVVEACAILARRDVPFRLLIAGSGDDDFVRNLNAHIDRAGIRNRTHLLGPVYNRDKVSLYQACDCLVLPSIHENFGFVPPEALASRLPVVVSKGFHTWPELERSGGAVVADLSPEPIADALQSLLADPARRKAMGEAGRAFVFDWLDMGGVARRYEAMYEDARRTSPGPPQPRG